MTNNFVVFERVQKGNVKVYQMFLGYFDQLPNA